MQPLEVISLKSTGMPVTIWQSFLLSQGFDLGPTGADGVFGRHTLDATETFQQQQGLEATGVVEEDTYTAAIQLGFEVSVQKVSAFSVAGVDVFSFFSETVLSFQSGMTIDADGSPHAYNPVSSKGLDNLANAGHPATEDGPADWWALVTGNGKKTGDPVVQGPADPAPGFYISTTALEDTTKNTADPLRYVDSEKIPFISLPGLILQNGRYHLGDLGYAFNTANEKSSFFIFADIGSNQHIGEGSIKLAELLGINPDARHGRANGGVIYLLFRNSGDRRPKTFDEIMATGDDLKSNFDIDSMVSAMQA